MIRDESSGALLGRSLGSGLGQGLAALIDSKMNAVKKSNFADLLGRSGYKGKEDILTELAERFPQQFPQILMALAQGQENPQEMQQQQNPESQFENVQQQKAQQNIPQLEQPNIEQLFNTLKTNPGALQLQGLQQQQPGLGNQQKQANPLQQKAQNPTQQQINPIESNFAQDLARGLRSKEGGKKNGSGYGLEPKHYDALVKQKETLQDIIATTRNMLNTLKKGVNVGIVPSAKAYLAPTLLDENSEIFDKDSSHLVNLTTGEVKGPASRYRVALVEKEKPSLKHSKRVNEQILERYLKKAETNLANLDSHYPDLENVQSYESALAQNEKLPAQAAKVLDKLSDSEPASDYEEGTEVKVGGYTFVSQNGQWVYKG